MTKLAYLSDGEFRVMNAIWSSEKELTQALVMKTVNQTLDKKLNVSTFATYLRRIIRKGYLQKIDHGDGHPTYHPLVSREEYFARTTQEFQERWSKSALLKMAMSCLSRQTQEEKQEFIKTLEDLK